jgi:hypothetical protein
MRIDEARANIVIGLMGCLNKLDGLHNFLEPSQRIGVAEALRDAADKLDCGAGDAVRCLRRKLSLPSRSPVEVSPAPPPPLSPTARLRVLPRFVKAGIDRDGQQLFKIAR